MKTEGFDHVAIVVKDMDKAVEYLAKLFEMEFEEISWAKEHIGMRISISRPDGQIELISVVDSTKAAKTPFPFNEIAEFAKRGGEGLFNLYLKVKDADEAVTDAKRKGVRIARIMEEKGLGTIVPHFKEVFFDKEDTPVKGISLVWREPSSRGQEL